MNFSEDDARYMARALQLAERGLYTTDPNPRVGCVIVKNGNVIAEGWHMRTGEAHAEAHALKAAGAEARGADVYITLEPCSHTGRTPPCVDALVQAGVRRVVAAMRDPNPLVNGNGFGRLDAAGIGWSVGLFEAQAQALNPGFTSRMCRGRPYVRVKIATSLDGRTALASGASRWISGDAARADVQRLRARSSAILTGINTVLEDDPSLNVRELDIGRQPLRVVVDSALRTPPRAKLLALPGATLIATTRAADARSQALSSAAVEVATLPATAGQVDLAALMTLLAGRKVNELLVEAGPRLCGALLTAGLVDELVLYYAPHLLGDDARGMFHLPGITQMSDRLSFDIVDVRAIGADWRVLARPVAKG